MAKIYGRGVFLRRGAKHYLMHSILHLFYSFFIFYFSRSPLFLLPIFGAFYNFRNFLNFFSGKEAEEKVVQALSRLSDDFNIVRNYRFPGGDIDLIVVGPSGIFLFEVKKVRGKVLVNREGVWYGKINFYEQLMRGVEYIRGKVPEYAKKCLSYGVVIDGGKIEVEQGAKNVLRWWNVPKFVRKGNKLSGEEVEEIMEALGV